MLQHIAFTLKREGFKSPGLPWPFCQMQWAMPSVLSISLDDDGEWGKRSEGYYLITLLFHDQFKILVFLF